MTILLTRQRMIIGIMKMLMQLAKRLLFCSNLCLVIVKDMAINIRGSFNFIKYLVALPATDLSLEDILLQQSKQATDYEAIGRIGVTYTFGSQFSNVVNTWF